MCKEKKTQKWRAEIQINGKKESLGYHSNELDAVRAYDRAQIVQKGDKAKTNLDIRDYDHERAKLAAYDFNSFQAKEIDTKARRNANWTSNYRGVRKYSHKQKNDEVSIKWRAEITMDGKKKSLGYHETEAEAAKAYDAAVVTLPGFKNQWLNFPNDRLPAAAPVAALPAPGNGAKDKDRGAGGAGGRAGGVKAAKSVGGCEGEEGRRGGGGGRSGGGPQVGRWLPGLARGVIRRCPFGDDAHAPDRTGKFIRRDGTRLSTRSADVDEFL